MARAWGAVLVACLCFALQGCKEGSLKLSKECVAAKAEHTKVDKVNRETFLTCNSTAGDEVEAIACKCAFWKSYVVDIDVMIKACTGQDGFILEEATYKAFKAVVMTNITRDCTKDTQVFAA